ncbi:MAG TPA: hypothetical protein PLA71_00420 [Saccharofermentans sp.]|nr:hypothetical protein [Saccharofermentans sp.]
MNGIRFESIFVQNFMSVGHPIQIDFEKFEGMNFIHGVNEDIEGTKNGAGKSVLWTHAISYALYGKTLNNTKNEFLANRILGLNHKKMPLEVRLTFYRDGHEYVSENKLHTHRIWEDGEEITKSTIWETRRHLVEQILRLPFELFKNSIVLASNSTDNFFMFSKSQKRYYLENIFGLTIFGEMLKNIRADVCIIDKEISKLNSLLSSEMENLKKYQANHLNFNSEKKKKLESLAGEVNSKKSNLKSIEFFNEDKLAEDKVLATNKLNALKQEMEASADKISNTKHSISALKSEQKHRKEFVDKFSNVLGLICDSCRGALDEKFSLSHIQSELQSGLVQMVALEEGLAEAQHIKDMLASTTKILNEELISIQKKESTNSKNQVAREHIMLGLDRLREEMHKVKDESNPFKQFIEDSTAKITEMKTSIEKFIDTKIKLEVLEHVVSEDGAKRYIIKDLKDVMNVLIRKYLDKMGAEFSAVFDEKFDCEFLTNTGKCEYSSFSNGEKKRIDVALAFAFRDILSKMGSISSNVLILDEVIDSGVDEYCIDAIISILKEESKDKNIFVISHREAIDLSEFDSIIEIRKKNGMSELLIEES